VSDPSQLGFFFDEPAPEAGRAEPEAPPATEAPEDRPSAPRRRPPVVAGDAARELADALGARLGAPVRLTITDNRTAMFSARKREGRIDVRANHVFLEAGPAIVDAMAGAIRRVPGARGWLRDYLKARREQLRPTVRRPRRRTLLRTRGAHHDLAAIFGELEEAYFPDAMTGVAITWGPRLGRRRRRRRSIQLGLYIPEDQLIRIHRALDQAWVPTFYVQSVVFHEMLHHCMPPVRRGNQVVFHTPQFRALEKVFPYHRQAEAWEKVNLDRLLAT
jgi:hypothetical protein